MNKTNRLYAAFKKDLGKLIEQVDSKWLQELSNHCSKASHSAKDWAIERRLVDRLDESIGDDLRWLDIRTAYNFRGTKW